MTGNTHPGTRILGSLRSADGKGVVRIEDRYDTGIDDLWSALTDPRRLARWYGQVEGDLRPGHRLRPGQSRQRLVPVPRRQQSGQVLAEPPPLRHTSKKIIEPGRVPLQRARRRRTRPASSHHAPLSTSRHYPLAYLRSRS